MKHISTKTSYMYSGRFFGLNSKKSLAYFHTVPGELEILGITCMLPSLEFWQLYGYPAFFLNWRPGRAGNHRGYLRGIHTMGAGNHLYECVPCMLPYLENWQSWECPACFCTWRTGNHGDALQASLPGELAIMGMPYVLLT